MAPFQYRRAGRLVALGYHQAPPEALEDEALLIEWAGRAYDAALRHAAKKPARRKPAPIKTKSPRGRSNRR